MSGALEDLDKGVRESVPGGWVTLGALALGGAGAMEALGGAGGVGTTAGAGGAGTLGTTAAGGTLGGAIVPSTVGAGGTFTPLSFLGTGSAVGSGTATFGTGNIGAATLGTQAGSAAATAQMMAGTNAAVASASNAALGGTVNPYQISPMQAMMMQRSLGGFGQQQATQTPATQIKQRREVNLADPIASLLAPKRKKERPMISLL
jgi:hypothetical protein